MWGYDCEEHKVETEDGYILTLHRIPKGKHSDKVCTDDKKVLILQHGFVDSSTSFMINRPSQSLAYLFAEDCYDVWLPNSRGNTYSTEHKTYSRDDEEYWRFSFDEMAQYDLPASIEYILKTTSKESLYYIGHSQGTTIGFMAFSENKELAEKVRFLGMLAPVGYAQHMTSDATELSFMSDSILYDIFGRKSFFESSTIRNDVMETACISETACIEFGEAAGGKFGPAVNTSRLEVYYTHTPAGSSVQNAIHWAQTIRSGQPRKYDFGDAKENIARYGNSKPPMIEFNKVEVPVALFTGQSDTLADPMDTQRLAGELPNVVAHVDISTYGHADFIWSMDSGEKMFKPLSKLMQKY